jgi:hypothetical protein
MRAKQFEDCARDFMRIAIGTKDPTSREQLVGMARLWMDMAVDEEAREHEADLPRVARP